MNHLHFYHADDLRGLIKVDQLVLIRQTARTMAKLDLLLVAYQVPEGIALFSAQSNTLQLVIEWGDQLTEIAPVEVTPLCIVDSGSGPVIMRC